MAEVLIEYEDQFSTTDGRAFRARVCGRARPDKLWEAWIEFEPVNGGSALRTGRETTQPNRDMLVYWARGLTWGYLDGALLRTLRPARRVVPRETVSSAPAFDRPAERRGADVASDLAARADARAGGGAGATRPPISVMDPFAVYAEGADVLRGQLAALSPAQLRNVVRAHGLHDGDPVVLDSMTKPALIERIMFAVREPTTRPRSSGP